MPRATPVADNEANGLTILGALAQLKQEIYQLQEEAIARQERPMFLIEGGELELKLVARRERKADGKLGAKFRLFVADAETSLAASQANTQETVQTLKLRFGSLRRPETGAAALGETYRGIPVPASTTPADLPAVEVRDTPSGGSSATFDAGAATHLPGGHHR